MRKYLQKKYVLTNEGTENTINSIISHTLYRLTTMLPMLITFIFLYQYSGNLIDFKTKINLNLLHYILLILTSFIIIYIFALNDYNKTYIKIYDESAKTRINLAEKLKTLPLSYFSKKDIADLSATIMSDTTTFEGIFTHAMPEIYAGIINTSLIAIILFIINYKLALSLFWVVPFAFLVYKLSKNIDNKILKTNFDFDREIIDDIQESLSLVNEIKAYNREKYFIDSLKKKIDKQKKLKINAEVTMGSFIILSSVLLKLGMATVAIYGAYLLADKSINIITYLIFIIISGSIFNPLMSVLTNLAELLYLDSIIERIKEINAMPAQVGSTNFNPSNYDIVFNNVKFSYEDGISVLNGVSFTAKQGEVTALVGPSGSGKTTAAKLAARFWDINSGKITLGGIDISSIEPETLLKNFSIVFQDVSLFNSTVMENIRLGKKGASDDEVKEVAKIARCDEFISKLPNGYDTLIGENGEKLSGGERQRISIARALLKDAPIILLDESTASLDAENESKIQESISKLIKDKTVIIIAHRMRTVIDADKIVVLKDGIVKESGKSTDLIKNDGIFNKMYKAQLENN
ncbi:ABC transporter ATP-binding protein [Oceanivirga salmonicida]|uniref:ABC transporter ATP-binding protein n=1 Tax=Oceanivirga salmonicida TaxID=1769291 RepID=UPI00082C2517|nr:ABC transporter ATP-binding protein [Oceanivirga salmonicida]